MAGLFEFVAALANEDACMRQLSERCGLGSPAAGRRAYEAAVGLIERRLREIGGSSVATKSLLRSARSFQQADRGQPGDQFEVGHVVGDELVQQVFGPEASTAMRALTADLAISEDKATGVLEITTAVFVSSAAVMAGDQMTVESLGALLVAEGGDGAAEVVTADDADAADESVWPAASPSLAADHADVTATAGVAAVAADPIWPDRSGGRSKGWLVAGSAVLLVAVGVAWVALSGGDDTTLAFSDETTTTVAPTESSADAESQPVTSAVAEPTPDPDEQDASAPPESDPSTADSDPATADGGADEAPSADSPAVPIGAPENHAVMSQGMIFLRGYLPSTDVEQQIVAAVEEIVGPGAVVSEYVIDPDRPVEEDDDEGTPVYIEDTVLFATGSAEIAPDFIPLLGAGLRLLQVQPGVTLEVTGHTDSQGSEALNLALSQSRVDAVKGFFVAQGIDPERVVAIGKGETESRADNGTAEGRQANRRVEFLVKGFSYGP
ncbi:MAG: OmpA family protein [Acidimicrobiia bacterium]|nr:OmpA family protein [Acidimicrobiia bacterium]